MLLFLCWLAPSASQMNSSVECNTTCQSAQLASMRALFTALGARPAPAGTFTFPNLPEHCSWGGVNCCNSSGLVAVSPEYSSAIAVPCFSPGGIVSVNLPYQGLTGILPDGPWSELAASMQIIDLTGPVALAQPAPPQYIVRKLPLMTTPALSSDRPLDQHCFVPVPSECHPVINQVQYASL